jgi:hypothetical protein
MRLCDGDPLEIGPRSEARLEECAFLLDPRLVLNRSLARVAYDSMRWRGDPPLAQFLERSIDRAMKDLVEEEAESALHCVGEDEGGRGQSRFLSDLLGLDPSLTRRACAVFNALGRAERTLWWSVCVREERIRDVALRTAVSEDYVRRMLSGTFELLSRATGRRIDLERKVNE